MMIVVGDRVMLKSGGPSMTVSSVNGEHFAGTAFCLWFTEEGELKSYRFRIEALQKMNDAGNH
jgi:uncharacterized protein YodC (DUF2158 family)